VTSDPRHVISTAPMSRLQVLVVAITIGLNALDGFDVLSISFASPGIAEEWGIDRAALGFVLAMELVGMAVGSVLLGGVADKIGRRPTTLGCLAVMSVGMFMATTVTGIVELSIWRVITGLGIGGMLAAINAIAAEFSNSRRRHLSVSLMAIGYPIGAVIGGLITAQLLQAYDWRSVFYLGTAATVMFFPVVYFFVPESVHWIAQKQPTGALETVNRTLGRMGHPGVTALPTLSAEVRKRSIGDIFAPGLAATTIILTSAYFFHITTFYFILKWVPKIVVDMGFPPSSAAGVLNWAMTGGALGGAVLGLLTQRVGVKALTVGMLFLSMVMVVLFGRTPPDLQRLSFICFCAGFFANGAIVGLYAIFAQAFPTHVRAFGTGFVIGLGRGGAALAPIIAGLLFEGSIRLPLVDRVLFEGGIGVPMVAFVMALGSLIAGGVLLLLKLKPEQPEAAGREAPRTHLERAPATS
jgi:benzoate transport